MKKTLFISGMLLFSAALSAQTTVKNSDAIKGKTSIQNSKDGSHINSTGSATSATSIQSDAAQDAKNKSYAEVKKENKAVATQKQTLAAEAKTKEQQTKKMASQDHSASVSAHSNTHAYASAEGNNYGNNTSIKTSGEVSSAHIKNSTNQFKNEEKANIETQSHAAVQNSNRVKANVNKTAIKAGKRIHATSSTAAYAGIKSAHAIRPKPTSIKMGTQIKTDAGIGIK